MGRGRPADKPVMDEVKELLLVWTIALVLMATGIAVAQYATDEPHLAVDAGASH